MLLLGQIINLCGGQPSENHVRFDFGGAVPVRVSSYRGFYNDLAIEYVEVYPQPTVREFMRWMEEAVGTTFQGYKGGDFKMYSNSRVWVANYGQVTDTVIIGIVAGDYDLTILQTGYEQE